MNARTAHRLVGLPGALAVAVVMTAATTAAGRQAPAPVPGGAATTAPRPPGTGPQGYTYNPEGRRDPFVSLVDKGTDQKTQASRPDGLPGVSVSDVTIRGIVASNKTYTAMVQGPDKRTYIVRNGDKLYDATVKAVLADAVVFVQQVTDPLSLVKQREIRKPLRPTEEGK